MPLVLTALVSLPFAAAGQTLSLDRYQHPQTDKDLDSNKRYLAGAIDALLALNQSLDDKQFCLPGTVPTLTFDQANTLVMHYANHASSKLDLTLGRTLMYALKQSYPCSR